jgi:acyl carrier protein
MAKKTKPPIDQDAIDEILIEELSVQDEQLVPTAKLIEDLGADPEDLTYIAVRLEDELDIQITPGAEDKFLTVQDIYNSIRRATRTTKF